MFITRWKDSRVLEIMSTVMKQGSSIMHMMIGAVLINDTCPNNVIMYQKMGGVDRGDQHCLIGAGFVDMSHVKTWYKKIYFGTCNFSLFYAFSA